MKKIAISILIMIVIVSTMTYMYLSYLANFQNAQKSNREFEVYLNRQISGWELTTIINKAIDNNRQNDIEKDKKGKYIDNGTNSLRIEIQFIDDEVTYSMENIAQKGTDLFFAYYKDIQFQNKQVQYHDRTNKNSYMLYEQVTQ